MTQHTPVMCREALEALAPLKGTILDATFGRGGYTRALLEHKDVNVVALDRDRDAIDYGRSAFSDALTQGRLHLHHTRFSQLALYVPEASLDGAVFDLGLSSPQLDNSGRGFSLTKDEPLHMNMGLGERKASDLLNYGSEQDIRHVLWTYGEEKNARALARKIVNARTQNPFQTTRDLVSLFEGIPRRPGHIHPATRTFQALRIWVNEELDELKSALIQAFQALKPEGRLVCVSFHSLEDRIVKRFLSPPPLVQPSRHLPQSLDKAEPPFDVPGKQPIRPSDEEIAHNPRARSAKLRFGIKREVVL
jgi:16S rRNA (cytosine1402-N4)-methyltransferase